MSDPLTPGEAAAAGARIMIECAVCGRARYVRGDLPMARPFAEIAAGMRCHSCHATDVRLTPVARDDRGRWPAERG